MACEKEKASQQWIEVLKSIKSVPKQSFSDFDLEDLILQQEKFENETPKPMSRAQSTDVYNFLINKYGDEKG